MSSESELIERIKVLTIELAELRYELKKFDKFGDYWNMEDRANHVNAMSPELLRTNRYLEDNGELIRKVRD